MAERRKIAIVYRYDENWIGGTYYIQNLISALNTIEDEQKPELNIITSSDEDYNKLMQITKYPYCRKIGYKKRLSFLQRGLNYACRRLFKREFISWYHKDLALVFPASNSTLFAPYQTLLYWIPDFQEHYLPAFFSQEELKARKKSQKNIVDSAKNIVFSSNDAKNDFNKFYPDNRLKQFVLQFAVTHPEIADISHGEIIKKYNLPKEYYICSNQFWKHKNHQVVLEAVANLKGKGKEITVVFTGKEHDYRNPNYVDTLKQFVNDNRIEDNIRFLGFISREDQLMLMKKSKAIIQPSLFEGWSTVIEDAKALNVPVIASNLRVNKEQIEKYPGYALFDPLDALSLSQTIINFKSKAFEYDYKRDIITYGKTFLNIVNALQKHF